MCILVLRSRTPRPRSEMLVAISYGSTMLYAVIVIAFINCSVLSVWGEAVIDITTTKIRTSTSELCTRGIDTCTLVTMVGQILTTVCWHCGMACLAIG